MNLITKLLIGFFVVGAVIALVGVGAEPVASTDDMLCRKIGSTGPTTIRRCESAEHICILSYDGIHCERKEQRCTPKNKG